MSSPILGKTAPRTHLSINCLSAAFTRFEICSRRFHNAPCRQIPEETPSESSITTPVSTTTDLLVDPSRLAGLNVPSKPKLSPLAQAAVDAKKARENMQLQQDKARAHIKMGGLAPNSIFADEELDAEVLDPQGTKERMRDELSSRNFSNIARVLNPRPNARARWQRRMVIRHVRRGGRLTKEMKIARTERKHLAKSHFFKTSMKKLAPLARQIAGKSIDEAILQMRFSKKRVAQEVREHLIQARNEAIAMKGMGIKVNSSLEDTLPSGPLILDPSITPPRPDQNPTKSLKAGITPDETDIYVAQAWTNQGPYGKEPEYRARGRMNLLRPPHTGISVILKEEKTRTREKTEKEIRQIKKRLGKSSWTQLPDRKITNQSQYMLW